MTFEYYKGSVFECAEIHCVDMIVNTVNCKGFMGAGLALEFKLRYPAMYEQYKKRCENGLIKVGQLDFYEEAGMKILNFPTKDDWKKPSKIDWIKQGLLYFYNHYKEYGIQSIAFPKLGTNHGGLNWTEVKDYMEKCFAEIHDLKIYICLDESDPQGVEGEMLNILHKLDEEKLKELGLRTPAIENLIESKPFKRFFQVGKVQGLGTRSYEKLHHYCYIMATETRNDQPDDNEQLSLFD